jgi:hypothetical protein
MASAAAWPDWDWEQARDFVGRDRAARAQAVISLWPAESALAARVMMQEYGPPDATEAARLAWDNNGPWLKTVVYKTSVWPYPRDDVLEQTVDYEAPQRIWPALAGFGRGLSYDARRRELSARSASEGLNLLVLNLADAFAQGHMSPEAADRLYVLTKEESVEGKSSRYMKGLLFATRRHSPTSDWRRDSRW